MKYQQQIKTWKILLAIPLIAISSMRSGWSAKYVTITGEATPVDIPPVTIMEASYLDLNRRLDEIILSMGIFRDGDFWVNPRSNYMGAKTGWVEKFPELEVVLLNWFLPAPDVLMALGVLQIMVSQEHDPNAAQKAVELVTRVAMSRPEKEIQVRSAVLISGVINGFMKTTQQSEQVVCSDQPLVSAIDGLEKITTKVQDVELEQQALWLVGQAGSIDCSVGVYQAAVGFLTNAGNQTVLSAMTTRREQLGLKMAP